MIYCAAQRVVRSLLTDASGPRLAIPNARFLAWQRETVMITRYFFAGIQNNINTYHSCEHLQLHFRSPVAMIPVSVQCILYLNKKLVTFSRSTVAVFCAHDVRCEIEAALAFVLTEPRLCTPGPRARDPARSPRSQRGAQQHSRGGARGGALTHWTVA